VNRISLILFYNHPELGLCALMRKRGSIQLNLPACADKLCGMYEPVLASIMSTAAESDFEALRKNGKSTYSGFGQVLDFQAQWNHHSRLLSSKKKEEVGKADKWVYGVLISPEQLSYLHLPFGMGEISFINEDRLDEINYCRDTDWTAVVTPEDVEGRMEEYIKTAISLGMRQNDWLAVA